MVKHPDRKALKGFISGELSSEDTRWIERHLSMCSECRDQADAISDQLTLQLLDSWLRPGYDEAFERAADRTTECLANLLEESRSTEDLLAELLREPALLRRRRIADGERFHSLKLCQLLLARSQDAWLLDPATALEMADLAVEAALHLESGRYGSSLVEDARALAWAYLANALKITSDLWRAEQALCQAWGHHVLTEGDPYTEAQLLRITSSLREGQGHYKEAVRLSDRAISIYRDAHDSQLEGDTWIKKGHMLLHQERFEESSMATRAGLSRIDLMENPMLLLVGTHNLICSLTSGKSPEAASELLEQNRHLYRGSGEIMLIRLRWLESRIAMGFEQFARAEALLHEVCESFLGHSMGIDVFLASLELAGVYVLNRQPRKIKKVLGEIIPLGEALGHSKVFLAKMLFEKASRS